MPINNLLILNIVVLLGMAALLIYTVFVQPLARKKEMHRVLTLYPVTHLRHIHINDLEELHSLALKYDDRNLRYYTSRELARRLYNHLDEKVK